MMIIIIIIIRTKSHMENKRQEKVSTEAETSRVHRLTSLHTAHNDGTRKLDGKVERSCCPTRDRKNDKVETEGSARPRLRNNTCTGYREKLKCTEPIRQTSRQVDPGDKNPNYLKVQIAKPNATHNRKVPMIL